MHSNILQLVISELLSHTGVEQIYKLDCNSDTLFFLLLALKAKIGKIFFSKLT